MKVQIIGKAEKELRAIFTIKRMAGEEVDPDIVCQNIIERWFTDHKDDIAEKVLEVLYSLDAADEVEETEEYTGLFQELSVKDDDDNRDNGSKSESFSRGGSNKIAVVVEDKNGKVYRFESQSEAARFLGIHQSSISTAINGSGYTNGYRVRKEFKK